MEETVVTFETAKLLASRGFDAYSEDYYLNESGRLETSLSGVWKNKSITKAYRQSLAQKWLREVYSIHISVICSVLRDKYWNEIYGQNITAMESVLEYSTYEEALENALQEALKLIK